MTIVLHENKTVLLIPDFEAVLCFPEGHVFATSSEIGATQNPQVHDVHSSGRNRSEYDGMPSIGGIQLRPYAYLICERGVLPIFFCQGMTTV